MRLSISFCSAPLRTKRKLPKTMEEALIWLCRSMRFVVVLFDGLVPADATVTAAVNKACAALHSLAGTWPWMDGTSKDESARESTWCIAVLL